MKRRTLVTRTTATAAALSLGGWTLLRAQTPPASQRRLVVILLRGAVDGLHVVIPHGETAYARARPTLAVPPPSADGGAIALTRMFSLHPALAVLKPHWDSGTLAFVHAAGSPDPTRSHFDAQDYFESGTPGRKSTPDGWLNRLIQTNQAEAPYSYAYSAINLGLTTPRILAGTGRVATLGLGPAALQTKAIDQPATQSALDKLYAADPLLARAYTDATQGRQSMQRTMAMADADMPSRDPTADAGAPSARSFAADAARLGTLLARDATAQVAFTSVGGWDTHVNQGTLTGQLPTRLEQLAQGLDSLARSLSPVWRDTVVVVASEFGRTVRQNGTNGTDHGRGNAMWLLGGAVHGGRVLGEWPGLDDSALADGRDLAVTTDFRAVLASVLRQHLGATDATLARVFPQWSAPQRGLALLRA